MNKHAFFALVLITAHLFTCCASSLENWCNMQDRYQDLLKNLSSNPRQSTEDDLCHPFWRKIRANIQSVVQGPYNPNFLTVGEISGTMVRSGITVTQEYELCFLTECVADKTRKLLANFQDTSFGNLPKECSALQCSSNTLGHLFYAARTVELMKKDPEIIIELGGGYGNLARIYKSFFSECTYIIIDLPEVLALQYFFLKENFPDQNIVFHTSTPRSYDRNAIHLIAVNFLDEIDITSDLFVSTFAISEASSEVQKIICDKKFFNASLVYITGQLNDKTGQLNGGFEHHNTIHNGLRLRYQDVDCHPCHLMLSNLKTYEIMAKLPRA